MLKLNKINEIFDNIKTFIKKYWKIILEEILFGILLFIIITFVFSCGVAYERKKDYQVDNDNNAVLCDYQFGAGTIDNFSKVSSDFILLNSLNFIVGNIQYRSVGSIFVGYDSDNSLLLLYPTIVDTSTNVISYKTIELYSNPSINSYFDVACIQTGVNFRPVLIRCYYDYNKINLMLPQENIYYSSIYDYGLISRDISTLNSAYEGYTNYNLYQFYNASYLNTFDLSIYNIDELNVNSNNIVVDNDYNPITHFNDLSGYNIGYNVGYNAGNDVGYDLGYNNGYNVGFNAGESSEIVDSGLFGFLGDSVFNILSVELFPNFPLYNFLLIGVGLLTFGLLVKLFNW